MIKKKKGKEEIHIILGFFIFYYYKPKNETINRKLDNSLTSYNKTLFLLHEMQYKKLFLKM